MTEESYSLIRSLWLVWLLLLFLGILAWVYWPSRRRRKEMRDHAEIPFKNEAGTERDESRKDD